MTHEVFIPFPGFYESWIDMEIDVLIEREAEELGVDEITPENYHVNFEAIARAYVDLYEAGLESWASDEGLSCLPFPLVFKELISPRFYNFETDRILCTIESPWMLRHLYRILIGNDDILHKDIQEKFSSRDGFASFYDNFVHEWRDKPLDEWDCNELSILLPAIEMDEFEDPELTTFREAIMNNVHIIVQEA